MSVRDAHFGRQRVVAGRALDQHAEAGIGEARAGILDHRMDDVAVAAFDQHVGHRLAERAALRDGEKVLLAFGAGADQKVAVIEPFGLGENRACHLDVVIEGEHMDHV